MKQWNQKKSWTISNLNKVKYFIRHNITTFGKFRPDCNVYSWFEILKQVYNVPIIFIFKWIFKNNLIFYVNLHSSVNLIRKNLQLRWNCFILDWYVKLKLNYCLFSFIFSICLFVKWLELSITIINIIESWVFYFWFWFVHSASKHFLFLLFSKKHLGVAFN